MKIDGVFPNPHGTSSVATATPITRPSTSNGEPESPLHIVLGKASLLAYIGPAQNKLSVKPPSANMYGTLLHTSLLKIRNLMRRATSGIAPFSIWPQPTNSPNLPTGISSFSSNSLTGL